MLPLYKVLVNGFRMNILYIMYFWLGLNLCAPTIMIQYTFINDFHLGVVELSEIAGIISLAWAIKPCIGFGVDYISRYVSRRFQISFAYCCSGMCTCCLSFCDNMFLFVAVLFLSSFFLAFADVVQDSFLVLTLQNSSRRRRGNVQSLAWTWRSLGSIFGCLLSASLSFHRNRFAFASLCCVGAVLCGLRLRVHKETKRKQRMTNIKALCDKNVVLFSILLFFFAYEPGDGSIFEFQMIKAYEVGPMLLAIAQILAFVMIMVSSLSFRKCCSGSRAIVLVTWTSLLCMLLILVRNLFLTKRLVVDTTFFFIGNVIWGSFFSHLSFMPLAVISSALCKPGAEATMYAYFMSMTNFAGIISRELSGFLADQIGIRKQIKVETKKFDLFYMICLILDFIGLIVVFLLLIKVKVPEPTTELEMIEFDAKDLEALKDRNDELVDVPLD